MFEPTTLEPTLWSNSILLEKKLNYKHVYIYIYIYIYIEREREREREREYIYGFRDHGDYLIDFFKL